MYNNVYLKPGSGITVAEKNYELHIVDNKKIRRYKNQGNTICRVTEQFLTQTNDMNKIEYNVIYLLLKNQMYITILQGIRYIILKNILYHVHQLVENSISMSPNKM